MSWHKWTTDEENWLKENWQNFSNQQIADHIGVTAAAAKKKARSFGLIKTAAAISSILKAKPNSGQFKKGDKPANTKFDHFITTRLAKNGRKYKWIRIAAGHWIQYHIYRWLQDGRSYNPKNGDVLRFIDGNTLNTDPSNLERITRQKNLEKNSFPRKTKKQAAAVRKEREKQVAAIKKAFQKEKRATIKKKESIVRKNTTVHQGKAKRQGYVFANRTIDYSQLTAVRIDHKTIIYAKPGEDISAVKNRYLKTYKPCLV